MAHEFGQGAVALGVPRDEIAPVSELVDDEMPAAVTAPVGQDVAGGPVTEADEEGAKSFVPEQLFCLPNTYGVPALCGIKYKFREAQ